jgi:trigger factor
MKINSENQSENLTTINIELEKADYQEDVDKALKDYRKKANMPGFRPGMVPMGMIKKMYGNQVIFDEVNKKLSQSLQDYLTENKIQMLGEPLPSKDKTTKMDLEGDGNFEFFFDVATRPEFDIPIDENTTITKYKIEADKKDVDKYVLDIQKRYGNRINPEVSEKEDMLYGDVKRVQAEEGEEAKKSTLLISYLEDKAAKDFIGKKVDDEIVFNPKKAFKSAADLASFLNISKDEAEMIDEDYRFTITEISRIEPAKLDNELFDKVFQSDNIQDEAQLRERIQKDLEESYQKEAERKFFADVFDYIINNTSIDIPDEFMKRWLIETNNDITEEILAKEYDGYRKMLIWQMIEDKLLKEHKVEIDPEDAKAYIRSLLKMQIGEASTDEEKERLEMIVENVMKNKEEMQRIYQHLVEEKLTAVFNEIVKTKEKKINYEDFITLATKNN